MRKNSFQGRLYCVAYGFEVNYVTYILTTSTITMYVLENVLFIIMQTLITSYVLNVLLPPL